MEEKESLVINLNPVQISSLDAFAKISGCYQQGKKDVCFIRYIGYDREADYLNQISSMDSVLDERKKAGIGEYCRADHMDSRIDPDRVGKYAAVFERWSWEMGMAPEVVGSTAATGSNAATTVSGATSTGSVSGATSAGSGAGEAMAGSGAGAADAGKLEASEDSELCFHFQDALRRNTLRSAFREILKLYRASSAAVSDSMVKNFGVKLLYWADTWLPLLFQPAAERQGEFPKFVLTGNIKVQEYLFLYLLVCLGCDVLWLNPQQDISLSGELEKLSYCCKNSFCGSIAIPAYAPSATKRETLSVGRTVQQGQLNGNVSGIIGTGNSAASVNNAFNSGQGAGLNSGSVAGTGQDSGGTVKLDTSRLARPGSARKQQTTPQPTQPAVTVSIPQNPRAGRNPGGERRQLEYEELAGLSPGIVMISAFDKKGECFKTGSGVIISQKGYILTNFHVAVEAAYYGIRFEEEERLYETDQLVKYNQFHDLAIIKIEKHCKPIPLYQGGKDLVRGQKVVAIGSPLGLFNSVSDGIISGFRMIGDVSMIQFTAPISHGSSGGALLNMYGELIGIITAGFDDGQNINLAVEYKTVQLFAGGFL